MPAGTGPYLVVVHTSAEAEKLRRALALTPTDGV
jgi:hypothetical protein